MNTEWSNLMEFESRDLVERFFVNKFNREPNNNKILQITSNFTQAREYLKNVERSNNTVRPLLQYYAVMSLSKGLILCLNNAITEEQMKSSHGLDVKNWNQVLKNKDFENLIISIGDGTFSELITATTNSNYTSINSSGIQWKTFSKIPDKGTQYTLKNITNYFIDLEKEYNVWTDEKLLYLKFISYKTINNFRTQIAIESFNDVQNIDLFFPDNFCSDKVVTRLENKTLIEYTKTDWKPNFTMERSNPFNIGSTCIIQANNDGTGLNFLGNMYIISYVFGMMARYYPSSWINLINGSKGDKIYPYVCKLLDYIFSNYPKQVLAFLNSPYEFEKK